jgi:hypothetical protein
MVDMKTTKAAKRERRERRGSKRRHRSDHGHRVLPQHRTLDPGDLAGLASLLDTFDPAGPWETVAPRILPVLKRAWYPYPTDMAPFHLQVPPGIPTGFGIDLGPAFSHATPQLIERWGVDHATLLATALDNLRALIRDEPPVVDRLRHAGLDITAVQGQGWGSALLLLPEVLTATVGDAPAVLLTPVRNTLLALPETVEPEVVVDLWGALADGARDALDVDPMRWTGTTVVALQDHVTQGLPN